MEKRLSKRSVGKLVAAAAVGLAGFGASQADASLIVDVRATAINGVPLPAAVRDTLTVSPGDTITLKSFAVMSGTNALNDESLQRLDGSFVSSGGLLGNLGNHVLTEPFTAAGSASNGTTMDIDGDGDIDLGQPNGGVSTAYVIYRAGAQTSGQALDAGSEEMELGTFTFEVAQGATGETLIQHLRRRTGTGGDSTLYATFVQDGAPYNGGTSTGAALIGSDGLTLVVPEPTGLALAGLATLGLLSRRRNSNA